MFAIYERYKKAFLLSTDKKCLPYRQRLSKERMILFEKESDAMTEFRIRQCDPERFAIVEMHSPKIKRYTYHTKEALT